MARLFSQVDLLLVPSVRDEMLTITNVTRHTLSPWEPDLSRWQERAATGHPHFAR
jgi:hypothetical protein